MKTKFRYNILLLLIACSSFQTLLSKEHPCLMLTKEGVSDIQKNQGNMPLFDQTLKKIKAEMDLVINNPVDVPTPKDAGGGYTHERHKKNYNEMYQAGILYQVYKDEKYASFVKNMLEAYAKMYPALPLHPVQKSNYRGKLFWQGLNECVWLVHTAQAYDCVYDYISPKDRKFIEQNLFYPMVKFISEDNKTTFNKIHNHATWATAGVGMIGYVMNDKDLIDRSLSGSAKDGKTGFLRQIDLLFSPDGYFTEGPYYQRYSLQPFIVFAQAIQNNEPERNIFTYRDNILLKAVNTSLQMAYTDGQFFHLNDALDKTWESIELVYGVDIAYNVTKDRSLLSIAKQQNQVILSDAGMQVAKDLSKNLEQPFVQKSMIIRDGPDGTEGGIGILRMGDNSDQTCVVMKATSQGMGHGHFDKLTITFYDNGHEILQDYGAARFLNIEPKNGGHYLPENDSWAKQTIAHNTLVVDETSNYQGKLEIAEKYSPKITRFVNKEDFKLVSAIDTNAYPGVKMERTAIMLHSKEIGKPIVIDIFDASSNTAHQYDLSYYFIGQLINSNFKYNAYTTSREPLGTKNGYQYLWKEATGKMEDNTAKITFLNGNRFYSITSLIDNASLYLNRIGANDPNFNLRNEPSFMIRKNDLHFRNISVIEPHGDYNPKEEYTIQPQSIIKDITSLTEVSGDTWINIELTTGKTVKVAVNAAQFRIK